MTIDMLLLSLIVPIFAEFFVVAESAATLSICPIPLDGSCQCFEHTEELNTASFSGTRTGLMVECSNMTGVGLHHDIDSIVKYFNGTRSVFVLVVRDSNLAQLRGLPSGLIDMKHLTLDNTNIDLEQIRESSEILFGLRSFKIYREKFTEIPEDFFRSVQADQRSRCLTR
jgi:hypothetical protein